jgi:hypothetical protein
MTISYHFPPVMLAGSGHSSSEVNREVYLHSIPADARAAVQKVEDLLIGPKSIQVAEIVETGGRLIQRWD